MSTDVSTVNKKLIKRWDSERKLSSRQHRTCTTKHCVLPKLHNYRGRRCSPKGIRNGT